MIGNNGSQSGGRIHASESVRLSDTRRSTTQSVSSGAALRQNRFWICVEEKGGMVACFVEWLGHGMAETGTVATTLP